MPRSLADPEQAEPRSDEDDAMGDDPRWATLRRHRTPESAALAQWDAYPEADAVLVSVHYEDPDLAIVVTDTDPSHPMHNICRRQRKGWVCVGDYS